MQIVSKTCSPAMMRSSRKSAFSRALFLASRKNFLKWSSCKAQGLLSAQSLAPLGTAQRRPVQSLTLVGAALQMRGRSPLTRKEEDI